MSTKQRKSIIETLGERCIVEDVKKVEELKEEMLQGIAETFKEIQETAEGFAMSMSLIDAKVLKLDDEVKIKLISQLIQGALYGAVANEMAVQVEKLDDLIAHINGTTEESKVIDFAEKKAEKEAKADDESGEELTDEMMAEVIKSMLLGAIASSLKDTEEKTDGEA